MYFLESRKHLKNQELDPSLVRDRQGFASRKHVAWVSLAQPKSREHSRNLVP